MAKLSEGNMREHDTDMSLKSHSLLHRANLAFRSIIIGVMLGTDKAMPGQYRKQETS